MDSYKNETHTLIECKLAENWIRIKLGSRRNPDGDKEINGN